MICKMPGLGSVLIDGHSEPAFFCPGEHCFDELHIDLFIRNQIFIHIDNALSRAFALGGILRFAFKHIRTEALRISDLINMPGFDYFRKKEFRIPVFFILLVKVAAAFLELLPEDRQRRECNAVDRLGSAALF